MKMWRVKLRERSEGWFWECFDAAGKLLCRSQQPFAIAGKLFVTSNACSRIIGL